MLSWEKVTRWRVNAQSSAFDSFLLPQLDSSQARQLFWDASMPQRQPSLIELLNVTPKVGCFSVILVCSNECWLSLMRCYSFCLETCSFECLRKVLFWTIRFQHRYVYSLSFLPRCIAIDTMKISLSYMSWGISVRNVWFKLRLSASCRISYYDRIRWIALSVTHLRACHGQRTGKLPSSWLCTRYLYLQKA